MKKLLLIFTIVSCLICTFLPEISRSQIHIIGIPGTQTTQAISDSVALALKKAALIDSLNNLNKITFTKPNPTVSYTQGQAYWDSVGKALAIDMGLGGVVLQVGMESLIYVYNATADTLYNGMPVYSVSAYGGHRTVAKAKADSWATSDVLGITTMTIPPSTFGYVNQRGYVNDINTNAYAVGDTLWLSPTTAGGFTNIQPTDPNFAVRCGRVLVKSETVGCMGFVGRNTYRLTDLADAETTNPVTDQILRWNGTYWTNGSISSSASNGVDFFMDDTNIISIGANDSTEVNTLSRIPVTATATVIDSVIVGATSLSPVRGEAYLYNTAFQRTSLDAGVWTFNTYNSVSSTGGGRVSSIIRNIYKVAVATAGQTVTTTGTEGTTTRTATVTGATPFVAADSAFTDITKGSYLQTPQGLYKILTVVSTSQVTIRTPPNYANEAGVTYSKWLKLFGIQTATLTTTSFSTPTLNTTLTVQPEFTGFALTDKLGEMVFGVLSAGGSTTIRWYHNGTTFYSNFRTPLITLHSTLSGLTIGDAGHTQFQFSNATADTIFSRLGKEWLVPLPIKRDSTASTDSTWVKTLFDIDGLYGRKEILFTYGNASTAPDTTIWGATFNPHGINPDSLIVWMSTSDKDNTSISIEIYNSAGTRVYSSGVITCAGNDAWEYKGVAFGSFADLNEHAIVYRIRVLDSGDAVKIGQVYFKQL